MHLSLLQLQHSLLCRKIQGLLKNSEWSFFLLWMGFILFETLQSITSFKNPTYFPHVSGNLSRIFINTAIWYNLPLSCTQSAMNPHDVLPNAPVVRIYWCCHPLAQQGHHCDTSWQLLKLVHPELQCKKVLKNLHILYIISVIYNTFKKLVISGGYQYLQEGGVTWR